MLNSFIYNFWLFRFSVFSFVDHSTVSASFPALLFIFSIVVSQFLKSFHLSLLTVISFSSFYTLLLFNFFLSFVFHLFCKQSFLSFLWLSYTFHLF